MEQDNSQALLGELGISVSNFSLRTAEILNYTLDKAVYITQFPYNGLIKNGYGNDGEQYPLLGIIPATNQSGHVILLGDSSCVDDSLYTHKRCDVLIENLLKYAYN